MDYPRYAVMLWGLLYVLVIVVPIVTAWKRKDMEPSVYVNAVSLVILVFLPSISIPKYAVSNGLARNPNEVRAIIHIMFTFVACTNSILWYIVLNTIGALKGVRRNGWLILYEIVFFLAAIMTLLVALWCPESFIAAKHYGILGNGKFGDPVYITWVWPETIDAPISYFRIILAALMVIPMLFPWDSTGRKNNRCN